MPKLIIVLIESWLLSINTYTNAYRENIYVRPFHKLQGERAARQRRDRKKEHFYFLNLYIRLVAMCWSITIIMQTVLWSVYLKNNNKNDKNNMKIWKKCALDVEWCSYMAWLNIMKLFRVNALSPVYYEVHASNAYTLHDKYTGNNNKKEYWPLHTNYDVHDQRNDLSFFSYILQSLFSSSWFIRLTAVLAVLHSTQYTAHCTLVHAWKNSLCGFFFVQVQEPLCKEQWKTADQ